MRRVPAMPPRIRAQLVRPRATAVLGLVLLANLWWLPADEVRMSTVGGWVRGRPVVTLGSWRIYYIREGERITPALPDEESWDYMTRALERDRGDVLLLRARLAPPHQWGFWAPTRERTYGELQEMWGAGFTPEQRHRARWEFIGILSGRAALPRRQQLEVFSTGRTDRTRVVWSGYVHNLLSLAVFAAFVRSLGWAARVPAAVRAWRRRRDIWHGRCPECGYSTAGLPGPRCPECGESLDGK